MRAALVIATILVLTGYVIYFILSYQPIIPEIYIITEPRFCDNYAVGGFVDWSNCNV